MNAVIYARYSSDKQTEQSIEGQIRECTEYAEKNGIAVIGSYVDRAISGRTDDRPEFQRMLADARRHAFEAVIVWKVDRFGRSREDIAKNKAVLRRAGVQLLYAREHIPEGAEGIILEGLLESLAEYYSAELREKITRGMRESAYKCKFNGSAPPFGYAVGEDKSIVLDPAAAPVVRQIFEAYAAGRSMSAIRRDLSARGLRTPKGNEFSFCMISRMLQNRRYLGEYRWREIVIPGGIPQIIDEALFERVQRELAKNKTAPARARGESGVRFLLTGKLFCGHCRGTMTGDSGTSGAGRMYYYYSCFNHKIRRACPKKSVPKDWLEREVVRLTVEAVLTEPMIERISARVAESQRKEYEDASSLGYLRQRLDGCESAIRNILRAIEAGIFTETTGARLRELEDEREQLRADIAREELRPAPMTAAQVAFFLERFRGGDVEDPEYRQQIIDLFVRRVWLYDDRIVITYNIGGDADASAVETEAVLDAPSCSDMVSCGSPGRDNPNIAVFVISGILGIIAKVKPPRR